MQVMQPSELDLNTLEWGEQNSTASDFPPKQDIQPTISYYQNIPVHSFHRKTVETVNALQNLLNAPESVISNELPPKVVDDNYCFVIDGKAIHLEAILHDDTHWSYTSRLTQYFYSSDLRHFSRVNCVKAKGKIIAVKMIGSKSQGFNASHVTRSVLEQHSRSFHSMTMHSTVSLLDFQHDPIPLMQVYAVTRVYSFWKTCPSFRRIITLVDRVEGNELEMDNIHFQKRIFLQHIWRNAKQLDKERVKCEFNQDRAKAAKFKSNKKSTKFLFR